MSGGESRASEVCAQRDRVSSERSKASVELRCPLGIPGSFYCAIELGRRRSCLSSIRLSSFRVCVTVVSSSVEYAVVNQNVGEEVL